MKSVRALKSVTITVKTSSFNGINMESKISINGIDVAVTEEGTGPDMVLIHGIFASKEIMNPLFDYYKKIIM